MKIICPKCKSKNIIPIVYGYPSSELFELSEQGKVKLGGCEQVFGYMQSNRFCKDCHYDWHVDNLKCDEIKKYILNFGKISVVQILKKKTSGFMIYIQMAKLSIVPIL